MGFPVCIVVATPDHADAVQAIYAPYVTDTAISFEVDPPTPREMQAKVTHTLERFPYLVALVGDEVAGFAYATTHRERAAYRWAVDVSVYLDPRFHRRGIGRRLYERLFEILREQGYFAAFAGITLPNEASVGLHESLGFRPIGHYEQVGYKFGRWHTTGWWQLSLQDRVASPPEPIPFAQFQRPGR